MATCIGIDIGNRYTKVVGLECKPNLRLLDCFLLITPYAAQSQPGLKQIDAKIFWDEITKHIPLERIRASSIGINLPSGSVTATTLLLPRVTKNELTIVAQNEARRKMIPASGPDHIFESYIVGTRISAKIPRFEVLVMRSEKLYVQQILELFKHIGTSPSMITLSGCALFTLAPEEILKKQEVDTGFVDIGLQSINTSIVREGRLTFFRNTSYGLQDIIQDLSQRLNLSENETEEIIREKGIAEVDFDLKDKVAVAEEIMRQKYEASQKTQEANQKEEVNLLELRVLWQAYIDRIVHELRRSLSYYKEQSEGRRVEYIYFLGGGCQIKNLVNLLIKQIGGQWEIIFPFKGMLMAKDRFAQDADSTPIFTNAAALALSLPLKGKGIEVINFLPLELKRKEILAARRLILLVTKIVLISLFTLSSLGIFVNSRSVRTAIKKVEADLNEVKSIADTLKNLSQRDKKIKLESAQIQELISKRPDCYLPLVRLAKAVPQGVLLTRVSIAKTAAPPAYPTEQELAQEFTTAPETGVSAESTPSDTIPQASGGPASIDTHRIEIKAEAFADYETAERIVTHMRLNLEAITHFKNIRITPLKLEKISPRATRDTSKALSLTLPMRRTFTVTADMVQ